MKEKACWLILKEERLVGRGDMCLLSPVIPRKKKRPAKTYVCILLILSYTQTNTHRLTASTGKVIKIMWMQADLQNYGLRIISHILKYVLGKNF